MNTYEQQRELFIAAAYNRSDQEVLDAWAQLDQLLGDRQMEGHLMSGLVTGVYYERAPFVQHLLTNTPWTQCHAMLKQQMATALLHSQNSDLIRMVAQHPALQSACQQANVLEVMHEIINAAGDDAISLLSSAEPLATTETIGHAMWNAVEMEMEWNITEGEKSILQQMIDLFIQRRGMEIFEGLEDGFEYYASDEDIAQSYFGQQRQAWRSKTNLELNLEPHCDGVAGASKGRKI